MTSFVSDDAEVASNKAAVVICNERKYERRYESRDPLQRGTNKSTDFNKEHGRREAILLLYDAVQRDKEVGMETSLSSVLTSLFTKATHNLKIRQEGRQSNPGIKVLCSTVFQLDSDTESRTTSNDVQLTNEQVKTAVDNLLKPLLDDNQEITSKQLWLLFESNQSWIYTGLSGMDTTLKSSVAFPLERNRNEFEKKSDQQQPALWHLSVDWQLCGAVAIYCIGFTAYFSHVASVYGKDKSFMEVFGNCALVARASAAALNVHICLVLLPVSRYTLSYLGSVFGSPTTPPLPSTLTEDTSLLSRLKKGVCSLCSHKVPRTWVSRIIPFDAAAIALHKTIGAGFAVFALMHVGAHICNYTKLFNCDSACNEEVSKLFGEEIAGHSTTELLRFLLSHRATWTGCLMVALLVVAYCCILQKKHRFEVFWSTHNSLLLVLLLACLHGTGKLFGVYFKTVFFCIPPVIVYAIPRAIRRSKTALFVIGNMTRELFDGNGMVRLRFDDCDKNGLPLSSDAGTYVYLKVKDISRWEWHPFTLVPSRDTDKAFDLYVAGGPLRAGANRWTNMLVEKARQQGTLEVRVDGPIGGPMRTIAEYEVLVLVGGNVGVAPLLSALYRLEQDPPANLKRVFVLVSSRIELCEGANLSVSHFQNLLQSYMGSGLGSRLMIKSFVTVASSGKCSSLTPSSLKFAAGLHGLASGGLPVPVAFQRCDLDCEIAAIHEYCTANGGGGDLKVGVFACGSRKLNEGVKKACEKANRAAGLPFLRVHTEQV